jgi:hypothetical protein
MRSHTIRTALLVVLLQLVSACASRTESAASAAPDFGPNVLIFDPSMTDIQPRLDAIFAKQEAAQFGPDRYAYLFKPGKYNPDVQVGFYTQCAGLGRSPDDVANHWRGAFESAVDAQQQRDCNFWRCAETFSVTPTLDDNVNIWAVSQATSLRRVHVKGNLHLWDGGWSSGGFMADCKIDGYVNSGSQQQWFSRNADWGEWRGGNWNMVFVGTTNPPPAPGPIDRTRRSIARPSFARSRICSSTRRVATSSWSCSCARRFSGNHLVQVHREPGRFRDIDLDRQVPHRAPPIRTTRRRSTRHWRRGNICSLPPGIYHLDSPIRVTRPNTIVLGLGYATLVPDNGTPAMLVSDVDGVQLCGLLFEANTNESPALLQIGEPGTRASRASHAADPIFLFDICCRAGGAIAGPRRLLPHHQFQPRRRRQLLALARRPRRRRQVGHQPQPQRPDRQRRRRHDLRPVRRALPGISNDLERQRRARLLLPIRTALRPARAGRVDARRRARIRLLQSRRHGHDA